MEYMNAIKTVSVKTADLFRCRETLNGLWTTLIQKLYPRHDHNKDENNNDIQTNEVDLIQDLIPSGKTLIENRY